MKRFLSFLPKKLSAVFVALIMLVGVSTTALAAFGPNRPTFTMANPASYVTFNSITDNPVAGDERYFMKGAKPGDSGYTGAVQNVVDGQEVTRTLATNAWRLSARRLLLFIRLTLRCSSFQHFGEHVTSLFKVMYQVEQIRHCPDLNARTGLGIGLRRPVRLVFGGTYRTSAVLLSRLLEHNRLQYR